MYNVTKIFLTLVFCLGMLSFKNWIFADNIQAVKTAIGPQNMISSATGNVELRHYSQKIDSDSYQMITQTRANLTWGLLDDKVSSTLTLAVSKVNDATSELIQRRPQLYTEIYALQSKYFDLTPFVDLRLKTPQVNYTTTQIGLIPTIKSPDFEIGLLKLNAAFTISAYTILSSQKVNLPVEGNIDNNTRTKFGIVENNVTQTNEIEGKAKPSYEMIYSPMINIDMHNFVKGLSFTLIAEYDNAYDHKVKILDNQEQKDYYEATREVLTYYILSYKVNDNFKVSNQLITGHTGFYKEKISGISPMGNYKLTNLVTLAYQLY